MSNILHKINTSGVRLLRPLTPEETYKTIVQEAVKLVKGSHGSLFVAHNGILERGYTSLPALYEVQIRPRGFTYRAFKEKKTIIVDTDYIVKIHPQIKKMGIKSDILVPISYRNKPIGVISLLSEKSHYFNQQHVEVLKLFASMASLAIRKTQLYVETKKALESRDLFISMAAHELKTPLTTINGYVQLLHSKVLNKQETSKKWLDELSWETVRLTQLINEMLEVNRMRSGKLQYTFKECSLNEIIQRALLDFSFTHPHRVININNKIHDGEDHVVGDFDKLLQVIINILDNAAKFSPEETEIKMVLESHNASFLLAIEDVGIGIDRKELPRIFDEFYKAGEGHRRGMGLGLFICKSIIEQHKGIIRVRSQLNKGTQVEIKLPRLSEE